MTAKDDKLLELFHLCEQHKMAVAALGAEHAAQHAALQEEYAPLFQAILDELTALGADYIPPIPLAGFAGQGDPPSAITPDPGPGVGGQPK